MIERVCVESGQHDGRRGPSFLRRRIRRNSSSVSRGSSNLCFCRLCFAILGRRAGLEGVEKTGRDSRYFIHRSQKPRFVYLRRLVDSTDFSDELERRCPNLVRGNGWLEVEKSLDVSAHRLGPYLPKFKPCKRTRNYAATIRQRCAEGPQPIQERQVHSARRAWMTSMRAARAAGSADAMTAAANRISAETTATTAPGICMSWK